MFVYFALFFLFYVVFFKQKTAYEMRISDWSSDVCSSDLGLGANPPMDDALDPWHPDARRGHAARCPRALCREAPGDVRDDRVRADARRAQIGRASCRERVCQYV